jgi:hypothetical protein
MFPDSRVETPMRDARTGMRRTCVQTILETEASDGKRAITYNQIEQRNA